MLQNIHDKVKGWFAGILLGFISLIFALWGVSNYFEHGKKDEAAAKVNGTKIMQSQLNEAFKQYQRQQQLMGVKLINTPEADKVMKRNVLAALIRNEALVQGANEDKLFISQPQVQQALYMNPTFQVNGQFSPQRYSIVLSNLMFTNDSYLKLLKQQLLLDQLQSSFVTTAFAFPNDVENVIKLADQKRNVDYVVLNQKMTKAVSKLSDQEITAYYQQHQKQFKIPAKVKLAYVVLSLNTLAQHIQPTNAQVEQYYRENKENFAKTKQSIQQATPAIKKLLARRNAEKQFAAETDRLANLSYEEPNSLKPTAKALGLNIETTDYITRAGKHGGILANKTLVDQAFSNDVYNNGYNSQVINLDDGRQVVLRVAAKIPESVKPLADVQVSIVTALQQKKASQQLEGLANTIMGNIKSGKSLSTIASEYGLAWKQNRALGRDSQLPQAIISQAFNVMPRANKPAVTIAAMKNGDFAVIVVNSLVSGKPENVTEQQKQKLQQQIATTNGAFAYEIYADGLVKSAKIENTLTD